MSTSERVFNILAGLSVLSWAVLGAFADPAFSVVRGALCLLHTVVGLLFLLRAPLRERAPTSALALALPSFICGGILFRLSGSPHLWPVTAQIVFVVGTVIAVISLGTLGRSFAVLPAKRGLVVRGPYAIVRHPAYAGESLLALACALAVPTAMKALVFALFLPFLGLRIMAEERLLAGSEDYDDYRKRVRARLIPRIW